MATIAYRLRRQYLANGYEIHCVANTWATGYKICLKYRQEMIAMPAFTKESKNFQLLQILRFLNQTDMYGQDEKRFNRNGSGGRTLRIKKYCAGSNSTGKLYGRKKYSTGSIKGTLNVIAPQESFKKDLLGVGDKLLVGRGGRHSDTTIYGIFVITLRIM